MRKIGYAIVGCGMIAQFHINAIRTLEDACVVGVFDVNYQRALAFAEENKTRAFETEIQMWQDGQVEAVCICTPSGLHYRQAMAALEHGKHVLVEKPMALDLESCDKLIAAAEERNLLLGTVSQLRFSPAVQQVKKAVQSGALGPLICADLYMKFHRSQAYYDSSNWRGTWEMDGGGALMNQGIHGVDLLQYIAGPVKSVFARAGTLARNIEVEDTLSAVVEFSQGAIGVIQATTSMYAGFSRRLELNGQKGTIILEEDKILLWDVAEHDNMWEDVQGNTEFCSRSNPAQIGVGGHVRQLANFTAAVAGHGKLLVDGVEGRKTLEIILAAYESNRNGRPICL